ncbi:MAG: glycosyltransferase [Zymomonas mobilis]|uniref:Glycosyltransferase involved in cell wall biosynthesis n=1 Tax=Zymomonas mobilis TaxID=542 RepID=A0A542W379_ZYMMB|nr:glycosyltransferase [Zymomonas mobilis]TQL18034.1 glycosyltransferase involved in cell wall biosynthesis [Zymomonas mobilis]
MSFKIAYVINSVEGGGAALPVPSIGQVIQKGGADLRIFALTRRNGRALGAIQQAGLDVVVREGGEKDHLVAYFWLKKQIEAWGATHIWTSLSRATLLGQMVGHHYHLPVISWQHSARLKKINAFLLRHFQKRSAFWIGDSQQVTKLTGERLNIPASRLFCWPIFRANPDAPTAKEWHSGEVLRIGTLGRLHPCKGYDLLIEAIKEVKAKTRLPFTLDIGGEGQDEAKLSAAIKEAGLQDTIRLVGYVDQPQKFLAGLHLYVQPSYWEGFCVAVHEAIQAGLPVIASAVGEIPHSVDDRETGFLAPPYDKEALEKAFLEALAQPEKLFSMGQKGRQKLFRFLNPENFERTGLKIVSALQKL